MISLSTTPDSTKDLNENIGAFKGPVHLDNIHETRIQSGDFFDLHTDNPETLPLPSFQLLELQWFLQRVQGMAGAADVDLSFLSDSGSEYSDGEGVPGFDLDEAEDSPLESSGLPISPEVVRLPNVSKLLSKHHTEEADGDKGDEVADREGTRVVM